MSLYIYHDDVLVKAAGNWPMTSETLVNNYLQMFVKFVKSTEFTDLQ